MARYLLAVMLLIGVLTLIFMGVPAIAARAYGPPAIWLTWPQVFQYSVKLVWADGLIARAVNSDAPEKDFYVEPGEPVMAVCDRLEQSGLVLDAVLMKDYLVYTGLDAGLQAGRYRLSAAMSIVDLARRMQDATPRDVEFVVLPGWRIEEIAASMPTSGLGIEADEFTAAASSPRAGYTFLRGATTTEGFLYPDSYLLPRSTSLNHLLDVMIRNFATHLSAELQQGYARQGLSVPQAVTLASIVQREAVRPEESPLIAKVYLNRLRLGMRLEADPTVQYALGFNALQQTWWTNPLSLDDLKLPSTYNTYVQTGLPPAPISNPGADALLAVAEPVESPDLFFSARCDHSGYHNFAQTFEEHLLNLCR